MDTSTHARASGEGMMRGKYRYDYKALANATLLLDPEWYTQEVQRSLRKDPGEDAEESARDTLAGALTVLNAGLSRLCSIWVREQLKGEKSSANLPSYMQSGLYEIEAHLHRKANIEKLAREASHIVKSAEGPPKASRSSGSAMDTRFDEEIKVHHFLAADEPFLCREDLRLEEVQELDGITDGGAYRLHTATQVRLAKAVKMQAFDRKQAEIKETMTALKRRLRILKRAEEVKGRVEGAGALAENQMTQEERTYEALLPERLKSLRLVSSSQPPDQGEPGSGEDAQEVEEDDEMF